MDACSYRSTFCINLPHLNRHQHKHRSSVAHMLAWNCIYTIVCMCPCTGAIVTDAGTSAGVRRSARIGILHNGTCTGVEVLQVGVGATASIAAQSPRQRIWKFGADFLPFFSDVCKELMHLSMKTITWFTSNLFFSKVTVTYM